MMLESLFVAARNLYIEQFRSFVVEQRAGVDRGGPEIMLQLSGEGGVYRNLYCVDFIANDDGKPSILEMMPDQFLSFDPITVMVGEMEIAIDSLCWDDIVLDHDLPETPAALDQWFETWFDPAEVRRDGDGEFTDSIHSLGISPNVLTLDLGTAPVEALFDLLDLLAAAGAREVRINGSRQDSDSQ